jgi:hypothetical protein
MRRENRDMFSWPVATKVEFLTRVGSEGLALG